MKELWATINGYEDTYEISNLGRVKSIRRGIILSSTNNSQGYLQVCLWKNGIRKSCKIHRLVAQAFLPNPNVLPEVNHINGIKTDNNIINLEWVTSKENTKHAHYNGLVTKRVGRQNHLSKSVIMMDMKYTEIKRYENVRSVEEDGFSYAGVSRACNKVLKQRDVYKGRRWRFDI